MQTKQAAYCALMGAAEKSCNATGCYSMLLTNLLNLMRSMKPHAVLIR